MKQRPILPPTYFTLAVLVSIVLHFALPIAAFIPAEGRSMVDSFGREYEEYRRTS